jgi:7-carboxy-7-deazaguanine synthase
MPLDVGAPPRLRVTEIFYSLQGESTRAGLPTVFIRLTGCPLRCTWCDTAYAFQGGQLYTIEEIIDQCASNLCNTVCVTGGEPLAQSACRVLLSTLCDRGYDVSLETSGALDIRAVDRRVSRIMDMKAPGSGEQHKQCASNVDALNAHDELKFVLADRNDYEWARDQVRARHWPCPLLFSPVHDRLAPASLAQWILEDQLPVRLQIQLHKLIWGRARGR